MKPLAIDLFCGLGGWTEGLLAEGWDVVGFDIERHRYPKIANAGSGAIKRPGMSWSGSDKPGYKAEAFNATKGLVFSDEWEEYPAQLVIQDVLTLHGSQFRNADLIVASPPCQAYSYRAMPWKRAKALPPPDNSLFEACFRIQREASEAKGEHVPLIVENVKGAQPFVGRASAKFGSFYLWGSLPALMPFPDARKGLGGSWFFGDKANPARGGNEFTISRGDPRDIRGVKQEGSGKIWFDTGLCKLSSRSEARKAASAQIAKIPEPLSRHIARIFLPEIPSRLVS